MKTIKINGTLYIGDYRTGLGCYIILDYNDYVDEDRENELGTLTQTTANGWVLKSCDFDGPVNNCEVKIY